MKVMNRIMKKMKWQMKKMKKMGVEKKNNNNK